MPIHSERRALGFTPEQLFSLVADVERYPEFLPWCLGARVLERRKNVLTADLIIGFKLIHECYRSRIELTEPERIDVTFIAGPLKRLENQWLFKRQADGGTMVDFMIDYEFRSRVFQAMIGGMFGEATHRMVGAFETRAAALYRGPGIGAVA
ncbi:MAG: type II toxin-antitoxin system RatA family toxin [Alphaproteobacteria bacterium]|nr:type II toxin-antitoxin system RatA family toxin [Alphaproteobacteria bacterium]